MAKPHSFTIVIPTRNDALACRCLLEHLLLDNADVPMPLRVVFLANDTLAGATARLEEIAACPRFAALQPIVLRATGDFPTAEENIRHTLGQNLDQVDEHFLILGNTDCVKRDALRDAIEYLREHQLDLLLIGVVNREIYQCRPVRQFYTTPRHLNPKNRLGTESSHGRSIFADAMSDYGPVDYLAFIGCQVYSKQFFRALCCVEERLPDPLYSHTLGTLELSGRQDWEIGFFPDVVVVRVDDLHDTVNSAGLYKTARGLSSHILLSIATNSLHLSPTAFFTLVNAQMVGVLRGKGQYHFSNFLFTLLFEISLHVMHSAKDRTLRYSASELQDIVNFGARLKTVEIGLPSTQCSMISDWLQHFDLIGDYSKPAVINDLLSGASPVLALLDNRPGMERWTVHLQQIHAV